MENSNLEFKFEESDNVYSFDNKLHVINDEKLFPELIRPNIKNEGSTLMITSMNNTAIYDVIQIKVNMSDTGVFLINFDKEKFNEDVRKEVIEKISALKSNIEIDEKTQLAKAINLLQILNEYNPIYVSFSNSGEIKLDKTELEKLEFKFPFLFLVKPKKTPSKIEAYFAKKREERTEKNKGEPIKENKISIAFQNFPFFKAEYLFSLLFALLGSFALTLAGYEFIDENNISVFLFILMLVFLGTETNVIYNAAYKRGKLIHKFIFIYNALFIFVGATLGTLISYFVNKSFMKIEVTSKEEMLIHLITYVSSVVTFMLTNVIAIIINNMKKNKRNTK